MPLTPIAASAVDTGPTRLSAPWVFFLRSLAAGALLGLAACGGVLEGMLPPGVPVAEGWQTLPVANLYSRETVTARSLAFCRRAQCGHDSAIGVFTATGPEAAALKRSLDNPVTLLGLIDKPVPVAATPRIGAKTPVQKLRNAAKTTIEPFEAGDWRGVRVGISAGPNKRQAYGVILAKRTGDVLDMVITVSSSRTLADAIALAAVD